VELYLQKKARALRGLKNVSLTLDYKYTDTVEIRFIQNRHAQLVSV
jgi:hypothetical protein